MGKVEQEKKKNFFLKIKIYYFITFLLISPLMLMFILGIRFSESFSTVLLTILFTISFPLILLVAVYPIKNNKYDDSIDTKINDQIDKIKRIIIKMFKPELRSIIKEKMEEKKDDENISVKTVINVFQYYSRFSAIVLMLIIIILSYLLIYSKISINNEITTIITIVNIVLFSYIIIFCLKYLMKLLLKYSIYIFLKRDGMVFIFNKFKKIVKIFFIPAIEKEMIKSEEKEEW